MWVRRLIGGLLGLLLLVLGGFLGILELTGNVFAVVPGAMFLAATWLTWALPGSDGPERRSD